jgi:hypothetical protein
MSDEDIRRLDDTTLLLQRQAAADCGEGAGVDHRAAVAAGSRGLR